MVILFTLVIAFLLAYFSARFLGRNKLPGSTRTSLLVALGVSGLILVGMLHLPLIIAFRMYRDEFTDRLRPDHSEFRITRPLGSTGPFHVITRGTRGNTTYLQIAGDRFDFRAFVYAHPDDPSNPSPRSVVTGTANYNTDTKINLGDGWWYIEED